MAGRVYETMFELGARINSSFGSAFTNAQNQLSATSGHAEEANTMFGKLSMGLGAAAVGIGAAALAAGGLAVSVGDDLQKALNGVQASTGEADEQMGDMKDTLLAVYNNNFGENFEDIGTAMAVIAQQTDFAGEALQGATEDGLALRDTFGMEVNESIRTVDMMMKKFGVSSDEAFNLIAQGAQAGLDKNGNLLDSINEYSVHFEQLGLNSEEMMNMMANGAAAGVYDIDKLGDAMKEFGIRSKDGSKASTEGFEAMGLNAAKMSKAFAAGGDTAKEAFSKTTKALFAMENPLEKEAAGVALFGTMWEDVGAKGMEALINTQGSIDNTKDALGEINKVKYNTFGEAMKGIKRNLETGILLPISDKLLPKMNEFAGWITANMPSIQNEIDYAMGVAGSAITKIGTAITDTKNFFQEHWNVVSPILAGIAAGAITFGTITLATKAWSAATKIATLVQTGLNIAMNLSPMGKIIALVSLLVAGGVLLYQNWDTIKAKAAELWEGIKSIFSNIGGWFNDNVIQPILGIVPDWLKKIFSGKASAKVTVVSEAGAVGKNAAGTDNWRGGLTWVGELGPELVNLPKGAQVYDHNKSMKIAGGGRVSNLESKLSGVNNNSSLPAYSPQVIIQGNADENVITKALDMSFEKYKQYARKYEAEKRRLQFSPG